MHVAHPYGATAHPAPLRWCHAYCVCTTQHPAVASLQTVGLLQLSKACAGHFVDVILPTSSCRRHLADIILSTSTACSKGKSKTLISRSLH
eukprot:360997-Chlamydomonas_euryale.AAC.3